LGVALDRITKEVMLLTAFRHKPKPSDGSYGRNKQAYDNAQGNFNPGGGMKGWVLAGGAYLYTAPD